MKKNIGYGIIFSLILLAGCFIFYIFYQESYIKVNPNKIEVKIDNEYWTSGDVTVTVNYNDKDIRIKSYSFDGGKSWQTKNEYIASENEILNIVLKTSNNKKSEPIIYSIDNIDKEKPSIIANDTIYVAVGSELDLNSIYTVADSLSGIKGNPKATSEDLNLAEIGSYSVEIYALDYALNNNTKIVTIEVVSSDNPNLKDNNNNSFVSITGLSLEKTKISLIKGTSVSVNTIIKPTNATNKKIIWVSNNQTVATVNQEGIITAVSSGSATITATTADGNKSSDIKVIVTNEKVEVASITLDQTDGRATTDSEKIILTATISPENATDQTVSWNSSNTNVAIITNGVVTIKGEGSATITATTPNGKIATFKLVVKDNYTFQERIIADAEGNLKGYTIKIYKNGIDITPSVTNIISPFTATNDKKKLEIDISAENYKLLKDTITFRYSVGKFVANR